jgi:hypothetical protein
MILPYHGQLTVLQGMTLQRPATLYLQVCQLSDPAPANKEPVHRVTGAPVSVKPVAGYSYPIEIRIHVKRVGYE